MYTCKTQNKKYNFVIHVVKFELEKVNLSVCFVSTGELYIAKNNGKIKSKTNKFKTM